ncbi:MAG: DUF6044 family protein [Hymenobacter sp.]
MHEALVRVVALLSMYGLLRSYGLTRPAQRGPAAAVALLWAVLPMYSAYGLSVLGQPALLWAALRLRQGPGSWGAWAVCAAFPGWSALVLVGPFMAVAWGVGLLLDLARRGRAAGPATWRGVGGLALLLASYLVVEWRLVHSLLLAKEFAAHREAFDLGAAARRGRGRGGLREAARLFWRGQYRQPVFQGRPDAGGGGRAGAGGGAGAEPGWRGSWRAALAVVVALSLLGGAAAAATRRACKRQLPLLHAFTLSRFYFLLALPWVLALALVLRQLPAGRLAYGLVALQVPFVLAANPEFTNNALALLGWPRPAAPGYAAFVAPGLLGQVQNFIVRRTGQPPAAYRVACLGLPPAVAQLNGFYTLDSYQTIYPWPTSKPSGPSSPAS